MQPVGFSMGASESATRLGKGQGHVHLNRVPSTAKGERESSHTARRPDYDFHLAGEQISVPVVTLQRRVPQSEHGSRESAPQYNHANMLQAAYSRDGACPVHASTPEHVEVTPFDGKHASMPSTHLLGPASGKVPAGRGPKGLQGGRNLIPGGPGSRNELSPDKRTPSLHCM